MRKIVARWLGLLGLACACGALADELTVLSAGAVEPGLTAAIADFDRATVHTARVTFATASQLRNRLEAGERFDVVIAPPAQLLVHFLGSPGGRAHFTAAGVE